MEISSKFVFNKVKPQEVVGGSIIEKGKAAIEEVGLQNFTKIPFKKDS